ncbi:hypothetical protein ACOMHN_027345 [Nucella lapillus]
MICRFGTAALPKCEFLKTSVKNITLQASKEILSKCRDSYNHLSKTTEHEIQETLYKIQQATTFHQFECIRANHTSTLRSLLYKNNRKKKKKLDNLVRNTGTHVTNHFCQPGHSDSSLRCMPIEQLLSSPEDTSRRRRREFFLDDKVEVNLPPWTEC